VRFLGRLKASRIGRSLIRRWRRLVPARLRPAIIMYHRVADPGSDPWGLSVTPDNFSAHLAALKRDRAVLGMDDFVTQARAGTLPSHAVAITFDDGYHDNLAAAAPLLSAAGLPATLFLASAPSFRQTGYWFEDLADLILDARDPADARVQIGGETVAIRFGPRESADEDRRGWRAWNGGRTQRETLFHALWERIRVLPVEAQTVTLARIGAALGRAPSRSARPMTQAELGDLARGPFTIGGHTVDHVDLPTLDDSEAFAQIANGRTDAEQVATGPVNGFAYPYGRCEPRLGPIVQAAGFSWACTTRHAHVDRRRIDPYFLPRIQAEDRPDIDWLN
jgi:Predicted xylanase/chitin deacetylase